MSVSKNDLNFYLTGNDPFGVVTDTSQSIGGYPVTIYAPNRTVTGDITLASGSHNAFTGHDPVYVLSGSEIIYTSLPRPGRGALSTDRETHFSGDPESILSKSLFNNSFSDNLQQYRCIAVKNINASSSFKDVVFYIKHNSLTENTSIDIAIETPSTDILSGTSDNGTIITVVDSILTSYTDNHFENCVIKITSGNNINQYRLIISSDQTSGTLVLDSALPFRIMTGDTYMIFQKPSQRLASGLYTPSDISEFQSADSLESGVSINVGGSRTNGTDLVANELVYLWMRRTRKANCIQTLNNRIVISAHYRTV